MIKLWDGWVVTADQFQYILCQPSVVIEKGKERMALRNATYHKDLNQALYSFWNQEVREFISKNETTLGETANFMRSVESRVRALVKEQTTAGRMGKGAPPLPRDDVMSLASAIVGMAPTPSHSVSETFEGVP